eukprot:TRINITY_DN1580_c0_g1_i1.p1 TRINITY_DN1580_c0_g1~~TRINITY_DN1580_c0_g1_i1.p1  ORF type:complete len:258 (-),score=40.97 TRINITY_DN1580_c0_g1_i1:44-817(-)
MASILDLEDDVLWNIFLQLPTESVVSLATTCQAFRRVAADDYFWREMCAQNGVDTTVIPAEGWRTYYIEYLWRFAFDEQRVGPNLELRAMRRMAVCSDSASGHRAVQTSRPIPEDGITTWEFKVEHFKEKVPHRIKSWNWLGVGVANSKHSLSTGWGAEDDGSGWYTCDNFVYHNGTCTGSHSFDGSVQSGDVIKLELNRSVGTLRFWLNDQLLDKVVQDDRYMMCELFPTFILIDCARVQLLKLRTVRAGQGTGTA